MSLVFEKTKELGEALMQCDEFIAFQKAQETALLNKDAAEIMSQYLEKKTERDVAMNTSRPDPMKIAQCSTDMEELQQQLQQIPDVIALNAARDEFTNLMNQVNQVLSFMIYGNTGEDENCTGTCDTCSGCV